MVMIKYQAYIPPGSTKIAPAGTPDLLPIEETDADKGNCVEECDTNAPAPEEQHTDHPICLKVTDCEDLGELEDRGKGRATTSEDPSCLKEQSEYEDDSFCTRCWDLVMSNLSSIPLLLGTAVAVIWVNVHQESYDDLFGEQAKYHLGPEHCLFGHSVTLRFIVNDFFMCLFFGLAGKEVFETLQPGGSLYPPRRAINPLFSCLGGVIGPVIMYVGMCILFFVIEGSTSEELITVLRGWGVPTATDIALSWVMAVQIFGDDHPAVYYLVVLAILDDAIGIMIIAFYYQDPAHPVEPVWLLLVGIGTAIAIALRKICGCRAPWFAYVLLAGPLAWCGLAKAHVHPALALVFIVPAMPAEKEEELHEGDTAKDVSSESDIPTLRKPNAVHAMLANALRCMVPRSEMPPLDAFAHNVQHVVDIGLGFFTLANAGVRLGNPGTLTVSIATSLIFGKTIGIFCFGMFGGVIGFGLPVGVSAQDLAVIGAVAGVGLTVALFVSTEAFTDDKLQGQAKLGALLSLGAYPVAVALNRLLQTGSRDTDEREIDNKRWAVPVSGVIRTASGESGDKPHTSSNEFTSPRKAPIIRKRRKTTARQRPGGKMAECGLVFRDNFGDDSQAREMHRKLAARRQSSEKGKRVDCFARQILGAYYREEAGDVAVAFRGWRNIIEEKKMERAQRLLALSGDQDILLMQVAFSFWRENIKRRLSKCHTKEIE